MADLSRYLESTRDPQAHSIRCSLQAPDHANTDFLSGSPLAALKTLSFSKQIDLQQWAALAFANIPKKKDRRVERSALNLILHLLESCDASVQEAACIALENFAINGEYFSVPARRRILTPSSTDNNRRLIVILGGLGPLIRLMQSPAIGIQRHASGCVLALVINSANQN